MIHAFCYTLLALALTAILLEEKIRLSKAKATLFLGALAWITVWIFPEDFGGRIHVQVLF